MIPINDVEKEMSIHQIQPGTLLRGEPHPAAQSAFRYVLSLPEPQLHILAEAFASSAIDGNRYAEVCGETLRRCLAGEPVSDRYILGLAWAIKDLESGKALMK
jgi:hypothetical protein